MRAGADVLRFHIWCVAVHARVSDMRPDEGVRRLSHLLECWNPVSNWFDFWSADSNGTGDAGGVDEFLACCDHNSHRGA